MSPTKPKSWWHSWLDGAATVLDLGGTSVKMPRRMTDAEAIASDWAQVGQDLWGAIKTVETNQGKRWLNLNNSIPTLDEFIADPGCSEAGRVCRDGQCGIRNEPCPPSCLLKIIRSKQAEINFK